MPLAKVITVSDGVVAGTREDRSGEALSVRLGDAGFDVVERVVCADGIDAVADALLLATAGFAGLVVTTGGTGFGPRDLTPEGTKAVLDREAETLDAVLDVIPHALDLLAGGRPH
jgi:molybdopterin adenylyltransferase